jgi:protein-L-isoaspartate(D-aspartate) O-methyltransferase
VDAARLRGRLVDWLVRERLIRDPRIEAAFRSVPRHLFIPGVSLQEAYEDEAIVTHVKDGKPVSSCSQPAIMAEMLHQLAVGDGDNVLEIGAGTGYNAALLSVLAGHSGHVTTVDIDERFVVEARVRLTRAGFEDVQVLVGDGHEGFSARAPYQRIIVTAAAWNVAPAWAEQLSPGGRLVVPIAYPGSPPTQASTCFEKQADRLRVLSAVPCGFIAMRRPAGEAGSERDAV